VVYDNLLRVVNVELDKTLRLETILSGGNLAEKFTDADLDTIGQEVHDGYTLDKHTRSAWETKIDDWTNLALQVAEQKTTPWVGAANVKYPLITTAALQFSARAYPALLPGTSPVRGRVVGYDGDGEKTNRAIRVGKHMSYQLLQEMGEWEEEMDRLLFALPIVGTMFKKTYFSSSKDRNVSEVIYPKELVVNYWAKSLEDAPRITHELKYSENDIRERVIDGRFIDQDLSPATNTEEIAKPSEAAAGLKPPEEKDESTPYIGLEQCCWFDFDDDGYKEPYIITIDEESKKVLRIVPRFTEEEIKFQGKAVLRIEPTEYYTKFSFIPSPDGGFYDIGFGILLGPINETINSLINMLLDAGTMSNMQTGFVAKGLRIKGGNYSFTPNEWKQVNAVGGDLSKGFFPLPVREPSQVLFSLLGMMTEAGEKLSSVTEIMTGDIPGQNTKATVAMAAIEQGMKVFGSIYKRIHRSLSKEYKKLYILNSIYLEDQQYFQILDVGQEGAEQIGIDDYDLAEIDILPTSDPNVATQEQAIAKVEALQPLLAMGTINPQEYTTRMLQATEQPNPEALMKMPEPQPNEEFEFEKEKFSDESERAWTEIEGKHGVERAKSERELDAITKPIDRDHDATAVKARAEDIKKYVADLQARTAKDIADLQARTDLTIARLKEGSAAAKPKQ
jgi:chaperonin GroES